MTIIDGKEVEVSFHKIPDTDSKANCFMVFIGMSLSVLFMFVCNVAV